MEQIRSYFSFRVAKRGSRLWVATLVVAFVAFVFCASGYARGDFNQVECPSETEAAVGFSDTLPDCRAYELVSPMYVAGTRISGLKEAAPFISSNGEHVLAQALAGFAEAESLEVAGENGAIYEFSRTPDGWSGEAQDPPQSLYPFHAFERASVLEPSRSVWAVPGPLSLGASAEPFWFRLNDGEYVMREGHASFAAIGPVTAPGHEEAPFTAFGYVTGISSDLTHIVFRVDAEFKQLWPGDSTAEGPERGSLYEYRGTEGGEPVLVGVLNSGRAPWRAGATHVNEGAQLVSQCGTLYNGMSGGGGRIFFTAQHQADCAGSQPPVNELFTRVNASETVALSEPSKADCGECDTEGVPGEARFAGASEDGSIVYFTSDQALLPEAHGDSLYKYDFNAPPGERVALVAPNTAQVEVRRQRGTIITPVARVSADGTRVYFESRTVLPRAINENGSGEVAIQGHTNLYIYDAETGTVAFVADGEGIRSFDTTKDGEYLAFSSPIRLAEAEGETTDTSTVPQLFEYDATTGVVVRISKGQQSPSGYWCPTTGALEGFNCEGDTTNEEDTPSLAHEGAEGAGLGVGGPGVGYIPPESVDEGGAVVFTSELPLTPEAVEGRTLYAESGAVKARAENVYEYREGQLYLIAPAAEATALGYITGREQQGPLVGIDESGRDIFFTTVERLVPQDGDTQSSWYDAREDGGFPSAVTQAVCGEEACQGAAVPAPMLSTPVAPPLVGENVDPPGMAVSAVPHRSAIRRRTKRARCRGARRKTKKVRCSAVKKKVSHGGKSFRGRR